MFKYLLPIMILAMMVVGCNQESNILSPQDSSNTDQTVNEPNWITSPTNKSLKRMLPLVNGFPGAEEQN